MLLALVTSAFACPTIATGTPLPLSFDSAAVAIVREGRRTTFSVSINPVGDPQEFALVLPVPQVLAEHEVQTLDAEIFARLDGYSAPRHVADAGCSQYSYGGASDSDSAGGEEGGGDDGSVEVEAEYLVGDYMVVILSAEESIGLETWLSVNGYHLPDGADERLGEYIEGGSYFLAAKVAPGADIADGSPLAPLQVSYESDIFSIPMRLATLNSPGEQDMVIYAITDVSASDGGKVGIANYPEFTVPDKCMWVDENDDFGAFYDDLFTGEWLSTNDAGWAMEYAGVPGDCSPCSGVYVDEADIAALGFKGDYYSQHLTRLHMRYTPEQATEDLALYGSGMYEPKVTSFADRNQANFECIDRTCADDDDGAPDVVAPPPPNDFWACDSGAGGVAGLGAVVGALAILRRRRGY